LTLHFDNLWRSGASALYYKLHLYRRGLVMTRTLGLEQLCFDACPDHVAVIDEQGQILAVNAAWRAFARENGMTMPLAGLGANYLKVCEAAAGTRSAEGATVLQHLREIIGGERTKAEVLYPCFSPDVPRWFVAKMVGIDVHSTQHVLIAHQNVTELMMSFRGQVM
ncbi:MAG: hypothetical protein MI741_20105, partial [Rhodospirillales bacterium]|nr:hypothetical protein [Rhodospirillales bacterium]